MIEDVLKRIFRLGTSTAPFAYLALEHGPKRGMTIEEVAEVCNVSPLTLEKKGLRLLFNEQIADYEIVDGVRVYKLVSTIDESANRKSGTISRKGGSIVK
jgi:hypothetical protein